MEISGKILKALAVSACCLGLTGFASAEGSDVIGDGSAFETIVDATGQIALPGDDFRRDWALLGTWAVNGAEDGGVQGFHNTYTQQWVVDAFRETGNWPDGAVLIKELRNATTADYTTGNVSSVADLYGWFVMIKDTENRFPENRLWGEGWGWAFYSAEEPETLVTTDYEAECLGCHVPVQDRDWIYDYAYPVLRTE